MHGMDLIGTGGGEIGKAVFRRAQDHEHARKPDKPRENTSDQNGDLNHDYLNGMRIGEAKHPEPVHTFAVPTKEQARESPAAACAYYAAVVLPWIDEHPQFRQMGACQTCGKNTGNWCSMYQINDTRPACLDEATRLWTPMYDEC